MAVNTLTLYMPGSSVGIQVYEGSQLHLILVSQGANSIPSAPGETVRQDPFPQYVDDDELSAALAGVGGTSYTDTQAVDAVEAAATVAPTGAWDFTQAPTVAGVPVGTSGVAAADITDSTTVGRSVLTAADAAAARAAIGAGTSTLALGTTSTTAKAGDYQPTAANISDSTATGRSVLTAANAAAARAAVGAVEAVTPGLKMQKITQAAHTALGAGADGLTLYLVQG